MVSNQVLIPLTIGSGMRMKNKRLGPAIPQKVFGVGQSASYVD